MGCSIPFVFLGELKTNLLFYFFEFFVEEKTFLCNNSWKCQLNWPVKSTLCTKWTYHGGALRALHPNLLCRVAALQLCKWSDLASKQFMNMKRKNYFLFKKFNHILCVSYESWLCVRFFNTRAWHHINFMVLSVPTCLWLFNRFIWSKFWIPARVIISYVILRLECCEWVERERQLIQFREVASSQKTNDL